MLKLARRVAYYKGSTIGAELSSPCASAHHPPLHPPLTCPLQPSNKYARLGFSTGDRQGRWCVPGLHPSLRFDVFTVLSCSRLCPDDVHFPRSVPLGAIYHLRLRVVVDHRSQEVYLAAK